MCLLFLLPSWKRSFFFFFFSLLQIWNKILKHPIKPIFLQSVSVVGWRSCASAMKWRGLWSSSVTVLPWSLFAAWPLAQHSRQGFVAEPSDAQHTSLPRQSCFSVLLRALNHGCIVKPFGGVLQFFVIQQHHTGYHEWLEEMPALQGKQRTSWEGSIWDIFSPHPHCKRKAAPQLQSQLAVSLSLINLLPPFWAVGASGHFSCAPCSREWSLLRALPITTVYSIRENWISLSIFVFPNVISRHRFRTGLS